jgi:tetratricopeptide (TPR) repeat protein
MKWLRRLAWLTLVPTAVTGCSQNYAAERLFWKAQRQHGAVLKDPAKASLERVGAAVADFERLVKQVPDSVWAGRAQLVVGTLHLSQRRFDQAREAYRLVMQNYNRYRDLSLRARLSIAKSFQAEDRWDDAVVMYKEISEHHPWSQVGLEAPLYIAASHERRKHRTEAITAYERAVRIYLRLIPDAPTPALAMQVKGYLTLAHQRLGEWDKAIALLQELAEAQGAGVNRPLVLLTMASIYQAKVGDPGKADEVYQRIVQEFPEHPLGKVAKSQHEQIVGKASPSPAAPSTHAVPTAP